MKKVTFANYDDIIYFYKDEPSINLKNKPKTKFKKYFKYIFFLIIISFTIYFFFFRKI